MMIRLTLAICYLWWLGPLESAALTAEEIVLLKQNGVSETTIRMMIASEMQAATTAENDRQMGVETISRPNGQPAIIYSTGGNNPTDPYDEARRQEERAWEMLRYLIVDTRRE